MFKRKLTLIFQISAVFIGTIVGAGLASGQEMTQFFTTYGYKSFIGLSICFFIYIFMGSIIIDISIKHKLNSYNSLISLVSPGFLGKTIDLLTGLFLISGSAIILAGSGALLNQYFGISRWIGTILMVIFSLFVLFRNTKGLITINSFIVPSLMIVIITIFILYMALSKDVSLSYIKDIPNYKNHWLVSTLIYGGFNLLCCSGVLVPLSTEIGDKKSLKSGLVIGSLGLTILSFIINLLLLLNVPNIFKFEIPLLFIANRFGRVIQIMLLCIIWLEMFSTEVSDIYSVGKTMEQSLGISYKKSVFIIMLIAIPISQLGFVKLISVLYPSFAVISFIFMIQCIVFYIKDK
ncbi:transporter [Clostridium oceanicum]|uniref:Transporter n=1 Tax=Clostridium oceanicum TaxID=1543 RepID=A0ABN1JRM7_9CLOT